MIVDHISHKIKMFFDKKSIEKDLKDKKRGGKNV